MKYALLIYSSEARNGFDRLPEAEQRAVMGEYYAISELPGTFGGAQLQPAATATTVRVEDGQTLTTDGPFTDTKEVLGGFYLFEADGIDAALDVASRIPAARMGGSVEVRPLVEM
ncbi:MAG TPA: YciI family protein [Gaiellaceae bacterium]|jgi:hypothetical protein|nr:YciI family protein [Gaiellaceae bacterium]